MLSEESKVKSNIFSKELNIYIPKSLHNDSQWPFNSSDIISKVYFKKGEQKDVVYIHEIEKDAKFDCIPLIGKMIPYGRSLENLGLYFPYSDDIPLKKGKIVSLTIENEEKRLKIHLK